MVGIGIVSTRGIYATFRKFAHRDHILLVCLSNSLTAMVFLCVL